jgi:DNA primase
MPIQWLLKYWEKMAEVTLPYLLNRPVALQQKFDHQIIYRRHGEKTRWIRIQTKNEIIEWARQHTFSFHPHLLGEKDLWFIMDLDLRGKMMGEDCLKIAVCGMAELLEDLGLKYLLKFSGSRGYHFLFSWGKKPTKLSGHYWTIQRNLIKFLASKLEERILKSKNKTYFVKHLKNHHKIFTTTSTDPNQKESILIDEAIVHKNGMIRSPYSVHPETLLVSLPLNKDEILKFNKSQAKPDKIKPKKIPLPINNLDKIIKKIKS